MRTPARLVEFLRRWYESFPDFFQRTLEKSVEKLESMKARGEEIRPAPFPQTDHFPIRVTTEINQARVRNDKSRECCGARFVAL